MHSNHSHRQPHFLWFWFLGCAVGLTTFGGCDRPVVKDSPPVAETVRPAPVFEISDVTDDTFQKQVLESPIPVLADFGAPWCGPCRMLEPEIKELAAEFHGKVRFVKINIDENPRLSGRFVIQGIPLLVVFRKGKAVGYTIGLEPETKSGVSRFLKQLDTMPDQGLEPIDLGGSLSQSSTNERKPVELGDQPE